jgi:putative transposase
VGAENLCHLATCTADRWLRGPAPARTWDDLRLVGVKLIFLIVTRAVSLLGLSRREWWWKDAEILMLRHQLALAERERPRAHSRLTWPDRAWLALLAGTMPAERLAAMRQIVTPGTMLVAPRHRPPPVGAAVALEPLRAPGNPSQGAVAGAAAGPGERVVGVPADPRASWQGWASRWHRPRFGRSSRAPESAGLRGGMARVGRSSSGPRRRGSWRWTSSPPACSTARRSTSLPSSSTAPAASGSSEPPSIQPSPGSCSRPGSCSWTWKTPGHEQSSSCTTATPASSTFDSLFQAAGTRVIRSAAHAPRMHSIMERLIGSCRRELLDQTLIWNQRHLMTVLREYEDFYNSHRPHRALDQAAPLRPLPDRVTDLDHFRVRRHDRANGVIHDTAWWHRFSAPKSRHVISPPTSPLGQPPGAFRVRRR